MTDTDPKAARRAERQVASMFALSMILVVVFVIAYVIDVTAVVYVPVLGEIGVATWFWLTFGGATSSLVPERSSGPRN